MTTPIPFSPSLCIGSGPAVRKWMSSFRGHLVASLAALYSSALLCRPMGHACPGIVLGNRSRGFSSGCYPHSLLFELEAWLGVGSFLLPSLTSDQTRDDKGKRSRTRISLAG
ncbi:hypothetical protein MN608_07927 [Microdochium nivale]|nr:hypothetical protein MN608_07927 [Microdochium nivale]